MRKALIRIIAVLEVVGGLAGIGFVAWSLATQSLGLVSFAIVLLVLGIDILSLAAGVALWRDTSFGRKASIVIQLIQIPKIVSPTIIFMFSFGFDLWVHFLSTNTFSTVGFQTAFLVSNQLFFNVESAPVGMGVSVTALVFLFALLKYRPREPEELLPPPAPVDFSTQDQGETSA